MGDQDKFNAVSISVTLSSQLIAASLAMLAIVGGYVAFVLDNRDSTIAFSFLMFLSSCSFVLSVFVAGKAITKARNAGFAGNWDLEEGKDGFNFQALLNALGLLLFIFAVFLSGSDKKDTESVDKVVNAIESIANEIKNNSDKNSECLAEKDCKYQTKMLDITSEILKSNYELKTLILELNDQIDNFEEIKNVGEVKVKKDTPK